MKIQNRYMMPGSVLKRWEKTPDGFLRCRARVLREGIMPYSRSELRGNIPMEFHHDPIQMLVSMDSMASAESLRSLEGAAVVVGSHNWVIPENAKTAVHGHVAGSPRIDGPFVEVDLIVTDPVAISRIESGELPEISAAYHADSVFELDGNFDGKPFDARQTKIRYNHIAVVPLGAGRAGADVRILNTKGVTTMEGKLVRITLPRSGRFVNTDEEGAAALAEESKKNQEVDSESKAKSASLEKTMESLDGKNQEAAKLQAEIDELKGELSVYKEKLDELLSEEAVEHRAMEMNAEQGDADEIIENIGLRESDGKDMDAKKKEEFRNSLRKLHGPKLHAAVLGACGVQIENMSPEALKGAFHAQTQILRKSKGNKAVAGAGIMASMQLQNMTLTTGTIPKRTALERLGFKPTESNK